MFNLSVGFAQLRNPSADDDASATYALFIGDTVQVQKVTLAWTQENYNWTGVCLYSTFYYI